LLLVALGACTSGHPSADSDEAKDGGRSRRDSGPAVRCELGTIAVDGGCAIDPLRRFEPEQRVDFDNVVSYGDVELTLDLPDPPKSGFRLIVPPRMLAAGEELEACHAWAYPAIEHKNIYAARVYTNGGLHHSNLYGVPLSVLGASPYPACTAGQGSVTGQIVNLLAGDIMDVLFANSTQIADGEQVVFPEGMAFAITTEGRELTTTLHWLNVRSEAFTSEVVYDFFTMPDEMVETPLVPFVFEPQEFAIEPRSQGDITSTCPLNAAAGQIVTIMPHTHKRAIRFQVDLLDASGKATTIFEDGNFDTESDIEVFPEAISLAGFTHIRHRCRVNNDLDQPIVWGLGDNEMCTLFGYLYPPAAQQLGFTAKGAAECLSIDLGALR
jgi:hypothetical protein